MRTVGKRSGADTRRVRSVVGVCVLAVIVFSGVATSAWADDRNLLDGWRAKPNVLVILDSGEAMALDAPTSTLVYPAAADDDGRHAAFVERVYGADVLQRRLGPDFKIILERGSKLHQAKVALREFVDRGNPLNLGFSFFENQGQTSERVGWIYRVASGQPAMLDGSLSGDPIRIGPAHETLHPSRAEEQYALRYGEIGDSVFVAREDPFGSNQGTVDLPVGGDLRLVSFLVEAAGNGAPRAWKEIPMVERRRRSLFFHPAFDFDALPGDGWIRSGLLGEKSWLEVAAHLGINIAGQQWKEDLRRQVLAEISNHSIGTETLWVKERFEVFRERLGWAEIRSTDCPICPRSRTTELHFSQRFVVPDLNQNGEMAENEIDAECRGFLNGDDSISTVVALAVPDALDGETEDTRSAVRSFLGPQGAPLFFFPTRQAGRFLPATRDSFLPLTETVVANGGRPLTESLREARFYFDQIGRWDDPLKRCRDSFIVVITDGGESCEGIQAACSAASSLTEVPVYVILFGGGQPEGALSSLDCIVETTGGRMYSANDGEEISAALEDIVEDIDQRSRAFASLALPPRGTEQSPAFLASFVPRRGRSIWEGHVSAYSMSVFAGAVDGGILNSTSRLWDAGEILAKRWDWGDVLAVNQLGTSVDPRSVFYGVEDGESKERRIFAFPGNGQRAFDHRSELGRLIYGRWPDTREEETNDGRARLNNVVDFIRGVSVGTDGDGRIRSLRDAELYGWCGSRNSPSGDGCGPGEEPEGIEKLGDIFHSRPQVMAFPSCASCYWTDLHEYKEFFSRNRHRRSVLFVGADDGAMHAFDAGLWDPRHVGEDSPRYDVGSGRELFAWIPTSVMGSFPLMAESTSHRWTVDGTPSIADVWIDPDGTVASDREWRSVLLWGQRRGGRSVVCLDVTDPDPLDEEGVPSPSGQASGSTPAPSSLRDAGCRDGDRGQGCIRSWPLFRWEFTDGTDEDKNGVPDLGLTWSRPVVAFVRIMRGGTIEERMVAFFGGGMADHFSTGEGSEVSGNFVYGLDVESGKILLKEAVRGMVPGDVQLLDFDSDGFVEQVFFGTTSGDIYRIDMTDPGSLDSATGRIDSWRPQVIFSAGPNQPFFMRPTLVPSFVDAQGGVHLALLIGSGNRDDLLEQNQQPHRFYVFLVPGGGGLEEKDLIPVTADSQILGVSLMGPDAGSGWFLDMESIYYRESWEKVVTPALAFDNAVVFSTFDPGGGENEDGCGSRGVARSYVVNLFNGDPLPGKNRYDEHEAPTTFVGETQVFVAGDGSLKTFQVGDDLRIKQPLPAKQASVGRVDWKEE